MFPKRYADGGGDINEWDQFPRSPEGRPQITVTRPTPIEPYKSPYDVVSNYAQKANNWLDQPTPIKPTLPPQRDLQEEITSQVPGQTAKSLLDAQIHSWKELANPFVSEEKQQEAREAPVPPAASRDLKIPPNQKDTISQGAPIAAEVFGTFGGVPGTGAGWAALKSAGYGISQAAIAFGLKASQGAIKSAPQAAKMAETLAAQHGYLDTTKFTKVGHQLGYMPGGVYKNEAGIPYYLKFGTDLEQVKNENLAAKLYQLAGVPAAEVSLTHIGGKPGIASKLLPNSHQLSETKVPYNQIPGLHDNFVVDAWLANHDAVGTGHENPLGNIMIMNGQAYRIDGGGALRFKGSGQLKSHFSDEADEIFNMRDPNFSKRSAQVYGDISDEALKAGAQKVANVDMKQLAELIAKYGPSDVKDQLSLIGKLAKRRQYIMDHFGVKPQNAAEPINEVDAISHWTKSHPQGTLGKVDVVDNPAKPAPDDWWENSPSRESDSQNTLDSIDITPPGWDKMDDAAKLAFLEKESDEWLDGPELAASLAKRANEFIDKDLNYQDVFGKNFAGKQVIVDLENGKPLSDAKLSQAVNNLLAGSPEKKAWNAAYQLWKMAEDFNPQVAEKLFRSLPPKIQIDVGRALDGFAQEVGHSPFDLVKKIPEGKKTPYNFYNSHTKKFPTPEDWVAENLDAVENIASLLKKGVSKETPIADLDALVAGLAHRLAPAIPTQDYTPIPSGWANAAMNAPKEAEKLTKAFFFSQVDLIADIKSMAAAIQKIMDQSPSYGDKVLENIAGILPHHETVKLVSAISDYAKKEAPKLQKAYQEAEAWKKSLNQPAKKKTALEEYEETQSKDLEAMSDNRINWSFFNKPKENIQQISDHFDKIAVPVKNWTDWTPREGGAAKSAKLENITPKQAKELGFNPNVTFYHASHSKKIELIDPKEKKDFEKALYAHHQSYPASKYGSGAMLDFVAKAPKAVELNWPLWAGGYRYGQTAKAMNPLIKEAEKRGIDLIIAHNIYDIGGLNTQYMFLKPHKGTIRSLKAKFDPAKLHTGLVNSSLVGGAAFTYGAVSSGKDGDKMNRGGIPALVHRAKMLARGGPGSAPWSVRNATHPRHRAGMIQSSIPGRTDKIPMSVPPGSYILPADVPSALGEGNTMAGEKILGTMFNSGPYSPKASAFAGKQPKAKSRRFAEGGAPEQTENEDIPIIAAGGEYVIHPEQVAALGNGDMKAGHKVLDKFVLSVRKKNIQTLRGLKPPKK